MEIMLPGFEDYVRSMLGIDEDELSNEELNSPIYEELAEALIKKRVPDYATITDEVDLLYLRNATMYQVAALVCPSLSRKLNLEVSTLDVKWKKDKVGWIYKEQEFLEKVESMLSNITTVDVTNNAPTYTTPFIDYVRNTRDPIGGSNS